MQSDLLAAFLSAQLEARERIQDARAADLATRTTRRSTTGRPSTACDAARSFPEHCEQAYHMFYVLLPSLDARTRLIAHLRERGILAVFHYLPLHLSEMGRRSAGARASAR